MKNHKISLLYAMLLLFIASNASAVVEGQRKIVRVHTDVWLTLEHSATSDRVLRVLVDAAPGTDISERFQLAIDRVRGNGGTVCLPPASFQLSKTV